MMQELFIEDIRLHAYHGCLEEEGRIGGKYRIDIKALADFNNCADTDDLNKTVDYVIVYELVNNLDLEWLATSHTFYLVNRTMQQKATCHGHHRLTSSICYRLSPWAPTPRKRSYRSLTFQADSSRTACSRD